MPTADYQLLAELYLRNYRDKIFSHEVLEETDAIIKELTTGLALVNLLIDLSQNDAELAFVSAGPLEDLLIKHYQHIFTPLDEIMRKNVKMRKALTGIWVNHAQAKVVLMRLLDKYHLQYASL